MTIAENSCAKNQYQFDHPSPIPRTLSTPLHPHPNSQSALSPTAMYVLSISCERKQMLHLRLLLPSFRYCSRRSVKPRGSASGCRYGCVRLLLLQASAATAASGCCCCCCCCGCCCCRKRSSSCRSSASPVLFDHFRPSIPGARRPPPTLPVEELSPCDPRSTFRMSLRREAAIGNRLTVGRPHIANRLWTAQLPSQLPPTQTTTRRWTSSCSSTTIPAVHSG